MNTSEAWRVVPTDRFFQPNTVSRRITRIIWMLRAMWALMLMSPLVFYAFATGFTNELAESIAKGATWIEWVDETPWDAWIFALLMALASVLIPRAIQRRSVAHLQARVWRAVDPCRPGAYRSLPGFVPEYSERVMEAACARHACCLALSFAMLASVLLVFNVGLTPLSVWGIGHSCRYFWRPVDYLPVVALVSMIVAAQFPTLRRMLSILQKNAGTNSTS